MISINHQNNTILIYYQNIIEFETNLDLPKQDIAGNNQQLHILYFIITCSLNITIFCNDTIFFFFFFFWGGG